MGKRQLRGAMRAWLKPNDKLKVPRKKNRLCCQINAKVKCIFCNLLACEHHLPMLSLDAPGKRKYCRVRPQAEKRKPTWDPIAKKFVTDTTTPSNVERVHVWSYL